MTTYLMSNEEADFTSTDKIYKRAVIKLRLPSTAVQCASDTPSYTIVKVLSYMPTIVSACFKFKN